MTLGFILAQIDVVTATTSWPEMLQMLGMWLVYIAAMFVLNFIVQKNDLTKRNTYRILLFAAFTAALPMALIRFEILLSGFFILLAIRRIISLRSGLAIERKLFDASFWIAIASLFYFWAILFYLVLFLAIVYYVSYAIRYWLIPLVGAGCVAILASCYLLYREDGAALLLGYLDGISFDFKAFNSPKLLVATAFFTGIFLWSVINYVKEMQKATLKARSVYVLVLAFTIIAMVIVILNTQKTGGALYFLIPMLSVIVTTYIERAKGQVFKEALLWLIVLLPFAIYVL
jgi:uncharacterized membrane protein